MGVAKTGVLDMRRSRACNWKNNIINDLDRQHQLLRECIPNYLQQVFRQERETSSGVRGEMITYLYVLCLVPERCQRRVDRETPGAPHDVDCHLQSTRQT